MMKKLRAAVRAFYTRFTRLAKIKCMAYKIRISYYLKKLFRPFKRLFIRIRVFFSSYYDRIREAIYEFYEYEININPERRGMFRSIVLFIFALFIYYFFV